MSAYTFTDNRGFAVAGPYVVRKKTKQSGKAQRWSVYGYRQGVSATVLTEVPDMGDGSRTKRGALLAASELNAGDHVTACLIMFLESLTRKG